MYEIQIEVRDTNKVSHFPYYEKVTREEAMREMVVSAMEPLLEQFPHLREKKFFVTPSKKWNRLPKHLYLAYEHEDSWGYAVYRVRRKPVIIKSAEFYEIRVTFNMEDSKDVEPLIIKYVYD